jgi:anthranilate 1,2-dioxygenase small subunit
MTGSAAIDGTLLRRVEQFLFAYAACLDEERFADWPAFFTTEPCTYQVLSRENVDLGLPVPIMGCFTHGMVKDRVAMLVKKTLTYRRMHLLRQVTNVRAVRGEDGALAAHAALVVYQSSEEGVSSLYMVARYQAALADADGHLLLRSMAVVVDSFGIDTMLAVPL